jgi:hypothetical protein
MLMQIIAPRRSRISDQISYSNQLFSPTATGPKSDAFAFAPSPEAAMLLMVCLCASNGEIHGSEHRFMLHSDATLAISI